MGKRLVSGFVWLKKHLGLRTYQLEMIIVALVLLITLLFTKGGWKERVGTLAVFLTFAYATVADRLAEAEHARLAESDNDNAYTVRCHWKLQRYYYAKELCRTIYFIALGAWAALIGVGLFLLYTPRRKLYRKHYPLQKWRPKD